MNAKEKLAKAKAKLLVNQPAFGHIVSTMEFRVNDDIQNYLSDGTRFEYNDAFVADASNEDLAFMLSSAALHRILKHDRRKAKRASYLWQLATDYAISSMLKESGFSIPDFARYRQRFDGMYAEEIYAILRDEIKNEEFSDDEELESGFNEENKQHKNQNTQQPKQDKNPNDDILKMEVELEERLAQKFIEDLLEKYQEELPEPIKRHFRSKPQSKINWRYELRRAIEAYAKEDYSIFPPSKKLLYSGIYLPSLKSEKLRLVIAVDSSGSIDETMLERFFSEVEYILLEFTSYRVDIIVADDKVREHFILEKGSKFPRVVGGGCGTDFKVVFEYIAQKDLRPLLLLFFSDLEGFFPKQAPTYEVVWVTQNTKEIPFGRKVVLS